ncbi:MAG: tRNA pseudouridine(38-40) synthase TruA [Acidobacteria bacterium]|nr:tRNA pseudouridine(38-40) synthase TruA [Acidobacteriota bacterium]
MSARNLKLTLAYDGSEFFGWQLQPDVPTVQGTLVDVLRRLTGEKIWLWGSSRTDAGVHAEGQVANFKTRNPIPPENLQRALNNLLPPSIRILRVEEVSPDFHARWHAQAKTYRYRILQAPICLPALWRFVYHYPLPLDAATMAAAAPLFEGERDFSSFGAWDPEEAEQSRIRTVYSSRIEVQPEVQEIIFTVRGRSFLRYQVRKLVGTLIEIGKGTLAPEDIPCIFAARDRSQSGFTAPPEGLTLVEVEYPAEIVPAASSAQSDADSV